ncbi:unnamed protein product [Linum tenue]|uniref:S-protein homolog n=1 Tax=Linum tenue TaxID=586396 RepID=A0AAV0LRQ6_9ROSI|nr:unnamed protein product [Linum tenue]
MVTTITRSPLLLLQVLLATVATLLAGTSSAFSLWPYQHVHIVNDFPADDDTVLHVHCFSRNDDRGHVDLGVGKEFTWRFKLNAFRPTRWRCEVYADDTNHHATFAVA